MNKFYVHQTLSASWGHLKGAKGAIWLSILLLIAAEIAALLLIALFQLPVNFLLTPSAFTVIYSIVTSLIFISVLGPFITLPLQFAIKKAQGNPPNVGIATNCFRYWLKLAVTFLFIALINWVILFTAVASMLPLLLSSPLLHIIQINNDQVIFEQITWTPDVLQDLSYILGMLFAGLMVSSFVSLFLMFSLPLVVNEGLNPMQAVWRSCKMVDKAWGAYAFYSSFICR